LANYQLLFTFALSNSFEKTSLVLRPSKKPLIIKSNKTTMNIIYLQKLNAFAKTHSNARKSLSAWKIIVENAVWKKKQDVLADFPNSKMIKENRARFEITHNTYRLIVQINYLYQIVEIRFIGTNNEYDNIDDPATI
jgi:mRNA interferase HigB